MATLLVLYSSHEGQTRKIIEAMLRRAPHYQVEWCDLHGYPKKNLSKYDKVLMGASIRYGHFHPTLMAFIHAHKEQLVLADAAFFGVNLTARKAAKNTPATNPYMQTWLRQSPWQPQQLAVFAGALRYSRYNWWQTLIIQFIMTLTGGSRDKSRDLEFTDWQQVDAFADRFLGQGAGI